MRKYLFLFAVALLCTRVVAADQHYAVVNGEPLTQRDITPMLKLFHKGERFSSLDTHEKEMVLDQSIERKLIVQDARAGKIEENPEFQDVLQAFKEQLMVEFWMKAELDKIQVSDADIKSYFEHNRDKFAKDANWTDFKEQLRPKVKMEKFQQVVDQKLSRMKKAAKIDFTGDVKIEYR